MNKKFIPILIMFSFFISSPFVVSAERLISTPTLITPETAPHSAKPKSRKVVKRNLKFGMAGSDVLALQKFLIKKATGPAAIALAQNKANGRFGPLTKKALEEFQRAKGLPIDGIAGAKIRVLYNS
ncbi:MAG: peptidoglycan-binding domain-containing protein [Patescibacteria group bacterium]